MILYCRKSRKSCVFGEADSSFFSWRRL